MNKKLKSVRDNIDELVKKYHRAGSWSDIEHIQMSTDEELENSALYAWSPTPICSKELGTTSDMSSHCAPTQCAGCQKRHDEPTDDLNDDCPLPDESYRPRFIDENRINPF